MEILDLKLTNFRNYEKLYLKFNNKKNIIIGYNGMGKTNLVEAIYVLSFTKSFRGTSEQVIIKDNEISTKIEANICSNSEKNHYKFIFSNQGKKVFINNNKQDKISDYISNINIILFNPDDLKIVKNSPSIRRRFLNIEISQISNKYLHQLNIYNKILKQRNSYLKTLYLNSYSSIEYLDILTNKLIDYGLEIYNIRKQFIDNINNSISTIFKKITGENDLKVKYNSSFFDLDKEDIIKKYKKYYEKDLNLGITQFGIHHDDFEFILNQKNLKDYGSEGQQKNAIIAFKLAELEIFKNIRHEYPILILDDLNSSLDNEKFTNILNYINKDIQIFITTTNILNISKKIIKNSTIFKVENGNIKEENNG